MKRKIHILFTVITLLTSQVFLAACALEAPTPPAPTETAVLPTQAPTPTLTPTLAPIPTPTTHPLSISPDNADQIVQLGQWGKGKPSRIIWSPDGSMIAIATSIGAYILDGNTFEEIMVLEKETEIVSLDFNSDNTLLALRGCQYYTGSSCNNPWVKIIDIKTQEILQTFDPGTRYHPSLQFHPNGKHLITSGCASIPQEGGCRNGGGAIWDIATGENVHDLIVDNHWMSKVAFHPNERYFASHSGSNFWNTPIDIIIWDMVSGTQLLKITSHEDKEKLVYIESIHFDQTGNVLFVKDSKQMINVYDTRNGDLLETVQVSDEENVARLFSKYPPGALNFLKEDDDIVQLWNQNGILHSRVSIPDNSESWAISPDLNQLANVTISDFSVIENGEIIFQQDWQNTYIEASGTLPDGRWVLAGSRWDDNTYLFDALTGEEIQSFPLPPHREALAISPNGEMIAISNSDIFTDEGFEFTLFDIETGQPLFSDSSPVYSLGFSPNSQQLVTGGDRGEIRLWDISDPTNASFTSLEGHATTDSEGWDVGIDIVTFAPNGKYLITGDWRQEIIHIWDVSSNKLLSTIHDSYDQFFILSPDGNTIIYDDSHAFGYIVFLEISRFINPISSEIQAPYIQKNYCNQFSFTFNPDGQIIACGLASASTPATIRLEDTEKSWLLTQLKGHTSRVRFLAFSPDGRYLVSNGFDGTTRIWGLPQP